MALSDGYMRVYYFFLLLVHFFYFLKIYVIQALQI